MFFFCVAPSVTRSDMEALRRDLQTLSERYSQKCLEIGALNQAAAERERELQRCQQEAQELLRQNQASGTKRSYKKKIVKLVMKMTTCILYCTVFTFNT